MKYSIAILIIFTVISCKSKMDSDKNQNIHRVWMLTSFEGFEKSKLMEYQAKIDLTNLKRGSANMGCNAIGFSYKISENNTISFSQLISTKKYCGDKMDLERSFNAEFPSYTHYKINGHKLTFSNDEGKFMKCVAEDWD